MTIRNFESLLRPKSIALIGASPEAGSIGRIVSANLVNANFRGPIWLVNPRHKTVDGNPCVASVADLPGVPDLAVIATPPATIPKLIAELGVRGTKAAVVISAGVTPDLRQAMLEAARPHLLRIQGPNCLGLMVPEIGLNASFSHRMPLTGDLAFVSQSGALVTAVVDWASSRGIGFSHVVSVGDMADVDFGDLLDYLAGDAKTRAILLYMEQLTHAPKFMSAARRAARSKPVVVLKSGRHAAGAKAAMSHTGALAGSDAAYDAAFRRAGLLRVMELEDLFEAAEMLARVPRLDGERLVILTNGGGAGVLAADRLSDLDGRLADLPETTRATLDAVLPQTWSKNNPVDIIGDADASRYVRALEVLMDSDAADAILVMNCPTALASSTDIARALIEVHARRRTQGKAQTPLLANWLGDGAAMEGRKLFAASGIPAFDTPAAAIDGFMQLVRYARAQDALLQAPHCMASEAQCDTMTAQAVIDDALARGQPMLSEMEAKSLLAAYGIAVVPTAIAKTTDDVSEAARQLLTGHSAVVIKILSDDITHKSDVGGVRLNLTSAEQARDAARIMLLRIAEARPTARIDGFTVQPMIQRARAHELIIGMTDDQTFGPMLMFGAGGTAVEVIRDTVQALPPLDLKLARDMMRETRVHRLLEGYRDRSKADLDAIASTLMQVSALVIAHPEIRELDINPLLADDQGVIALDARIRVEAVSRTPRRPLAIRPYPAEWQRENSLPGLGVMQLRPIRPDDAHLYGRFIERLTPEDMRMRFFIARPHASRAQIARFTQIDYAREMAFVAIEPARGDILGVARLAADPDYRRAEFAIIVASDLKGRGLGWALMQHLIVYARVEGLSELFGDVLTENETMLAMCRELGFKIESVLDDMNLKRVTLKL
jgi:acetyltransferase